MAITLPKLNSEINTSENVIRSYLRDKSPKVIDRYDNLLLCTKSQLEYLIREQSTIISSHKDKEEFVRRNIVKLNEAYRQYNENDVYLIQFSYRKKSKSKIVTIRGIEVPKFYDSFKIIMSLNEYKQYLKIRAHSNKLGNINNDVPLDKENFLIDKFAWSYINNKKGFYAINALKFLSHEYLDELTYYCSESNKLYSYSMIEYQVRYILNYYNVDINDIRNSLDICKNRTRKRKKFYMTISSSFDNESLVKNLIKLFVYDHDNKSLYEYANGLHLSKFILEIKKNKKIC